ncbi:MAG: glycosyltransferase [Candidatus Gottesmanbacteria bacterium]
MSILIPQYIKDKKTIYDYRYYTSKRKLTEIVTLSKKLRGISIAHLSVTNGRGGVARSLTSALPIYTSLGIDMHWYTLRYSHTLFQIFRTFRDIFQGSAASIPKKEFESYVSFNRRLAYEMEKKHIDLWIVHDYQPLPAVRFIKKTTSTYIWHFHQDYSKKAQNNKFLKKFLTIYLAPFSQCIFSSPLFEPDFLREESKKITVFTPCIDPLVLKNQPLSDMQAWKILRKYHINPAYPVISQISRFNPWKDPLGVFEAYMIARKHISHLQLVFMSHRVGKFDPEQIQLLKLLKNRIQGDTNVFFIINARNNDIVVNALQTVSDIILQKSIREGFGQTVSEAMWKHTAVIGGNAIGIRTQITSGVNGYIVDSIEACADKIVLLLSQKKRRKKIGMKAHQTVRKRFLLPTYIYNNLQTYVDAVHGA